MMQRLCVTCAVCVITGLVRALGETRELQNSVKNKAASQKTLATVTVQERRLQ